MLRYKRALGMPNILQIQLTYAEEETNIALNCNNIQIYNKKDLPCLPYFTIWPLTIFWMI